MCNSKSCLSKKGDRPKFVKNSNYVITLDKIVDAGGVNIIEKIIKHKNITGQIKEWQEFGIVDENFKTDNIFKNSPFVKRCQTKSLTGYLKLPCNLALKERARELRRAGNLSEVLLWNKLKQKQMFGLDFTRQQIIGNYIVDFHCSKLNLVIEIDGESHDFKRRYDEARDNYLKSLGLSVLHINDLDVKKSLESVVQSIKDWINSNTPSALQTPLLEKGELSKEYQHLPIDTKHFKDLEPEILALFDDLDKALGS